MKKNITTNETRHLAADFLTAQKFANIAAENLAAQWSIDENRAALLLTAAAGRRIFSVTHGVAETLHHHARHAAEAIAAALNIENAAAADLLAEVLTHWRENMITDDTTAAQLQAIEREGETLTARELLTIEAETITAAPAAGSLAGHVATAARVFLLACCLSAAAPAADDLTDEPTPCEIYTADPLAQVAEFAAAGLTVSHVTIKTTARELPAADVPALLTI